MRSIIQKLKIIAFVPILSCVCVVTLGRSASATPAPATSPKLITNVTCSDGTTDLKFTIDKTKHTVTAACASGAQLYYISTDDPTTSDQPVAINVVCPSGQIAGSLPVKNPNGAVDSETFICEVSNGRDKDGDPIYKQTTSTPTVTQTAATGTVLCSDGVTPAPGNDVSKCPVITTNAGVGDCTDLTKCTFMSKYVYPFINFLSAFVGLAVTISIVVGGIQYSSSAGDPQKSAAAQARIRNSIIALITFIFLYAMLNFLIPGGLF